jgi:hypothetical protein
MNLNPTTLMLILVGLQIIRELLGIWRDQHKSNDSEE